EERWLLDRRHRRKFRDPIHLTAESVSRPKVRHPKVRRLDLLVPEERKAIRDGLRDLARRHVPPNLGRLSSRDGAPQQSDNYRTTSLGERHRRRVLPGAFMVERDLNKKSRGRRRQRGVED